MCMLGLYLAGYSDIGNFKGEKMKYGIVTNRYGSAWWYGCYNDFETAKKIAKKVNGKVVIFN